MAADYMTDGQQQIINVAGVFILTVLFCAGVFDLYFGGRYGPQATISNSIQNWCQRWPILYIAVAWLLFHLTQVPCNAH